MLGKKWDRERADHKGLFKMYVDKRDNTEVYQSYQVVEEVTEEYKYVASITYTAIPYAKDVKKLIRWCPDSFYKTIMKNPKSYGTISKELYIRQITEDGNYYTVGKFNLDGSILYPRFSNEMELEEYLKTFINQKFCFNGLELENRIINIALKKFNLAS